MAGLTLFMWGDRNIEAYWQEPHEVFQGRHSCIMTIQLVNGTRLKWFIDLLHVPVHQYFVILKRKIEKKNHESEVGKLTFRTSAVLGSQAAAIYFIYPVNKSLCEILYNASCWKRLGMQISIMETGCHHHGNDVSKF